METKTIIQTTENFPISSNLFPCVFVGMYGTALSPTQYEEGMNECDDLYDIQVRLLRGCESIDAKHDFCVTFEAKNEAQRMKFLAVQKGLKVSYLYRMSA